MLSPDHHPCQALADLLTLREAFGDLEGRGSPTSATATTSPARWRSSARSPASRCAVAAPAGFQLEEPHGAQLIADPAEAAAGADALYTDVWVSMGDDEDDRPPTRREALAPYRLDDALLDRAAPGAIALHCLPAHPGEEITEEVLYGVAPAHLGSGREPPPRAEGAARAARWVGSARPCHQHARRAGRRAPVRALAAGALPRIRGCASSSRASSTRARSWCSPATACRRRSTTPSSAAA